MDVMKTIEIQKSTGIKDSINVIVNGEKYLMRHQSLKIEVDDNKPFELIAKQTWDSSPTYTFEPKDDMVLQISSNCRLMKWISFLSLIAMVLAFVPQYFIGSKLTSIIFAGIILLCPLIFFLIKRKKFFAIKEINKQNENNQ